MTMVSSLSRCSTRLGAFGFLASPDVQKSGRLNTGLLDQRFAIEWARQHIAKFGVTRIASLLVVNLLVQRPLSSTLWRTVEKMQTSLTTYANSPRILVKVLAAC